MMLLGSFAAMRMYPWSPGMNFYQDKATSTGLIKLLLEKSLENRSEQKVLWANHCK